MLYLSTINPETLALLKKIQANSLFSEMRLVGDTALALQIGHRKSIDLDFFGKMNADKISIANELKKIGSLKEIHITKHIKIYTVNNIKVDIVNYPYDWIQEKLVEDDIILSKIKDIAAMKFAAITNRGSKKDFIDIYFLLQKFSFNEILEFYISKYQDASTFIILKSITYFEDAENDPMPEMLKPISWNEVKSFLENTLKNYIKYK